MLTTPYMDIILRRKNVEVPFGLEIEPTSFFIKTPVDNEKAIEIFNMKNFYYLIYAIVR